MAYKPKQNNEGPSMKPPRVSPAKVSGSGEDLSTFSGALESQPGESVARIPLRGGSPPTKCTTTCPHCGKKITIRLHCADSE